MSRSIYAYLCKLGNLVPLNGNFEGGGGGILLTVSEFTRRQENIVNLFTGNFLRALVAIEMLWMHHLEFVHNVFPLNRQTALATELLRATFEIDITLLTERPA